MSASPSRFSPSPRASSLFPITVFALLYAAAHVKCTHIRARARGGKKREMCPLCVACMDKQQAPSVIVEDTRTRRRKERKRITHHSDSFVVLFNRLIGKQHIDNAERRERERGHTCGPLLEELFSSSAMFVRMRAREREKRINRNLSPYCNQEDE